MSRRGHNPRKARRGWRTEATRRRSKSRVMGPAASSSCGKIRYTSRAAAETAAELKAGTDQGPNGYPPELRVYYHKACRGFHITSKPKTSE